MIRKKSGVDIDLGNQVSAVAFAYAKETFTLRQGRKGRVASKTEGGFSNLLIFGKERIGIASDGIGTKAEVAERVQKFDTLGFDLVAMVADDLAASGLEPTNLSNVIDVDFLDARIIEQLMKGLRDACRFAGMTITGGEIAELGSRVSGYGNNMHFNWSATAIGVLPENLTSDIDGSQVQAGDVIVSLKSKGFRSNGFSAARRILQEKFGDAWHLEPFDTNSTWGEKLLTPSLIYAPVITAIIANRIVPSGIAHITGGGILDNLHRVLKMNGFGAELNNLYEPHPEMREIQRLGNISDLNAYRWWNMGNGMLMILKPGDVDTALSVIRKAGYEGRIAGRVKKKREISVIRGKMSLKKSM